MPELLKTRANVRLAKLEVYLVVEHCLPTLCAVANLQMVK